MTLQLGNCFQVGTVCIVVADYSNLLLSRLCNLGLNLLLGWLRLFLFRHPVAQANIMVGSTHNLEGLRLLKGGDETWLVRKAL